MVRAVEATYENGVFVPATPPGLEEHARVRLVIEPVPDADGARKQIAHRRGQRIRLDPEVARYIAQSSEVTPEEP